MDSPAQSPVKTEGEFDEQIKQIREEYAKEYSVKIQRGLDELADLKKDMACKQELFET